MSIFYKQGERLVGISFWTFTRLIQSGNLFDALYFKTAKYDPFIS